MQSLLILGRQPQLGLAELESLYGGDKVRLAGDQAAVIDVDPCLLAFDRLGGSVKFCKILTTLPTTAWPDIEEFLTDASPGPSQTMPPGKMRLGLSLYGLQGVDLKTIFASGLKIKKAVQRTGRSVRFVPNKALALNSAQVIHNQLTGPNGWELVLVADNGQTIVAQSVKVQDIEAYTRRDRRRPKRDPKVGMLPPKLAQIITNLAVGLLPAEARQSVCEIPPDEPIPPQHFKQTLLDPFCGSGVILQEALLIGYNVVGTDIDPRMVEYASVNVRDWFLKLHPELQGTTSVYQADAAAAQWQEEVNFVASETYLGQPLSRLPSPEQLSQMVSEINSLIKKFLINIGPQLKPGSRLCLALPAWQTAPNVFKRLPLIDQIEALGYNLVSFKQVAERDLIYYREGQTVARQLLVLLRQ